MWLTASDIKRNYHLVLKDEGDNSPIEAAMRLAARDLKKWLKPADYELGIRAKPTSPPERVDHHEAIVDAHALLTVSKYFLNDARNIKQQKDEVSLVTFLTPKEAEERSLHYLKEAQNQIAEFAAVDFSGEIETVEATGAAAVYSTNVPVEYVW